VLYLKGRFFFDLVALLPLSDMFEDVLGEGILRLLYLVKLMRLYVGFRLLDYKQNKKQIKAMFANQMNLLIESKDELAEN